MAIDLKREVSFDLKKKRDDPEKVYPTKRSMNLYRIEHPEVDKRKVGALVAILVVALGLFVRFGVAGPLMEIRDKEAELARVRAPIGLDLGSETPEEIALAVLAEILLVRNGASGRPLSVPAPDRTR